MFNYLPPEQMTSSQRDLPQPNNPAADPGLEGSMFLALVVASYLACIFAAVVLVSVLAEQGEATRSAEVGMAIHQQ